MTAHLIRCRARLVPECYEGTSTRRQFDEDGPMTLDNTWDGETIVCDPCYLAILPFSKSGQALTGEIPHAIDAYRSNLQAVQDSTDLDKLRRNAEDFRDMASPGSPAYESAKACVAMVDAEERRRAEQDS